MVKGSLKILYLGQSHGTSRHRADAMRRLGHSVELIDPWAFLPQYPFIKKVISKLAYEIGPAWLEPFVRRRLMAAINRKRFDVIWSNECELIGANTAFLLKEYANWLVTYANDDPFGTRDKESFSLYKNSIRHYDLMAVVRQPNIDEAYAHGARKVIRVPFTADEIAHAPLDLSSGEQARWTSEVAFVGTWMPERGPFLVRLMELGVPLILFGGLWQKAHEWPILKNIWQGPGIVGQDYVRAIQSARICLGLLSKGNRDMSTRRSAEIPYIGSVLCAERTGEHLAMYKEDEEAVFWDTPEECAEKCFALLTNEKRQQRIANAGRQRCIASGYLNEPVMKRILDVLLGENSSAARKTGSETTTTVLRCSNNA